MCEVANVKSDAVLEKALQPNDEADDDARHNNLISFRRTKTTCGRKEEWEVFSCVWLLR